jgi:transcriptional regulator with XRE-family HTH domain
MGRKSARRSPPLRTVPLPEGDVVGATRLSRRIGENLRLQRKARGMSLDELAIASGVSRAALSQIETSKSSPTVGVLWKIAVGLGVPITDVLAETSGPVAILRREDAPPLRSRDGVLQRRPLAPRGASSAVELYELRLAPSSTHVEEAHERGTREVLVVLTGGLRLRVGGEIYEAGPGDTVTFAADQPHVYENPSSTEALYHDVLVHER